MAWNCRCMITGISLEGATTAVVLRRTAYTYRPIALGISGTYDEYGGINEVRQDLNTEMVLRYFQDRLQDGRFVVDTPRYSAGPPFADIEGLLRRFERNNMYLNHGHPDPEATLDGSLLVLALIAQPVWDALTATADSHPGIMDDRFARQFRFNRISEELYQERLEEFPKQLRQLCVIDEFLPSRRLEWAPPVERSQRYPLTYGVHFYEEDRQLLLDEARRDYRDHPAVLAGLDAYERELRTSGLLVESADQS